MVTRKLYKMPAVYWQFTKLIGFESGLRVFIRDLELSVKPNCRILDIACGTGVIGLELLKKFPDSSLLATDLEERLLREIQNNADRLGIATGRIQIGLSNLHEPSIVKPPDGSEIRLLPASFDIVSIGGALGHSEDKEGSLRKILALVKPGGVLINLEMNRRFWGSLVSWLYHCRSLPIPRMVDIIERSGFECRILKLSWKMFPANLTRIGVIARRNL